VTSVETILVILLGASLFVLLALSIVLIGLLIAVVRNLHRIAKKAETATENISGLAATLSERIAPVAVSTIVAAIVRRFAGKSKKEDREE